MKLKLTKKTKKAICIYVAALLILYVVVEILPKVTDVFETTQVLEPGTLKLSYETTGYFIKEESVGIAYETGSISYLAEVGEAVKRGRGIEEAIAGLKFSSYLPSKLKELGGEEREDMINRWKDEYKEMKDNDPEKYKDLDPLQAAIQSLALAEDIGKIKSGLTEA